MILSVPTAVAKSRGSRLARDFADLRKTADPRTENRSLLVNLDKQVMFVHRPDGSTIAFGYDSPAGRLWTVTYPKGTAPGDGTVTVTRAYYSSSGQLASLTTSDGQSLSYGNGITASTGHDGSLLTSTTFSGQVAGTVGRSYDSNFRTASETCPSASPPSLDATDRTGSHARSVGWASGKSEFSLTPA
jgi:hypothetical protein